MEGREKNIPSLLSSKAGASHGFQNAKQDFGNIKSAQGLAVGVTIAGDNIGTVLATTDTVVTSAQDFLKKCTDVGDRIGFIVSAVDTIAEVYAFSPSIGFQCSVSICL
jgi:hypothetical protein